MLSFATIYWFFGRSKLRNMFQVCNIVLAVDESDLVLGEAKIEKSKELTEYITDDPKSPKLSQTDK